MIRSLVAVSPDIEASIALRFACELAHFCEMSIQAIYAKEPELPGAFSEIGWARRTWEREMIEKFEKEISKLVATESRFCPVAINPIVTTGDKEKVILEQLKSGKYDVFIEGAVSLEPEIIEERLDSKLYKHSPVPIILVRNLLKIEEVILLLEGDSIDDAFLSFLDQIFERKNIKMNLCFLDEIDRALDQLLVTKTLQDKGFKVERKYYAKAGDLPEESGLIAAAVTRDENNLAKITGVLGKIDAPILFYWRE